MKGTSAGFVGLLYHDVHPDRQFDYGRLGPSALLYHIPQSAFARHLQLIARSGTTPFGIDAVRTQPATGGTRGVVVCFDDGWRGAVTNGASMLQQLDVPAFFFITTAFIGRKYFANRADLRHLNSRLFTIGSHGKTHRMLSSLSAAEVRRELGDSRKELQDLLGVSIDTVSIPGGAVNARVRDIAREVGYTDVFTSTVGVNPTARGRFDIARIGVTRATSDATFARWLDFRLGREWWRKAALGLPKKVLGMHTYSKLRRVLLGEREHEHHFEP